MRQQDETEFHEPPYQPTAFGAATASGAAAAAALASGIPADERDARDEDTAGPGDGVVEDRDRFAPGEPVAVGAPHPGSAGILAAGDPAAADSGDTDDTDDTVAVAEHDDAVTDHG